jgi:predicted alpha/beta-hydrolase family hydrolase
MRWRVDVGGAATTAVHEQAAADALGVTFVCAHGAGGHMSDASMLAATAALRARGFDVVRFDFLYRERSSGRPDPMPQLMACVAAVAAHVRRELAPQRVILGGRSMGGRAASMLLANGGFDCDGLLLLAYPLHPAGQPDKRRDAHLARIDVPVLCFNGTRDALCQPDLMTRAVRGLPRWTQHWLHEADHSFHVLKRSGRTDAEVLDEMSAAARRWAAALPARR